MTNLKDKTALVWDTGLGFEHAVRLGQDFGKVIYYSPYQAAFSEGKAYFLGRGFEGTKKTLYYHDERKNADLFMFTDIGQGDLAHELRAQGKAVFGAGDGEKMENHRFPMRMLQKAVGLPTQRSSEVIGCTELEKHLEAHGNQFVKMDNVFRKNCESFPAPSLSAVEERIKKMRVDFGPFAETVRFTVEDIVKTDVELGVDGFFNGKWLRPSLYGFELGRCYIGTYAEELPPFLEDCMEKLTAPLNKRKYRGAISTEQRVVSPTKGYLIDMTCRFPYNLSTGYTSWIKNYSEVIWAVANGEDITVEPRAKYVGGAPIYTECEDKWVKWRFPRELRDKGHIKFRECAKIGGDYWAIKGCNSAAFLVSWGASPEDVVRDIKRNAKLVDCDDCNKTRITELDQIMVEIKKARAMGIVF